jgi:hypothetical protein
MVEKVSDKVSDKENVSKGGAKHIWSSALRSVDEGIVSLA